LELLTQILRPLIRYCLRKGNQYPELLEALKLSLAEEARAALERRGEQLTMAKVTAMTGLSRREVTRLLREGPKQELPPALASRILGQWENDRRFLNSSGKPRVLHYGTEDSEFSELVRSVNRDTSPATMLSELTRLGVVTRTKRGLRLESAFPTYAALPDEALGLLSENIESLARSAEENIAKTNSIKNINLRTDTDTYRLDKLEHIREWLLREGREFHKKVRLELAKNDIDTNPDVTSDDEPATVIVGTYSLAYDPATDS